VTQYEALPAQRPVLFRSWPIPPRGLSACGRLPAGCLPVRERTQTGAQAGAQAGTLTSAIRSLKSLPTRNWQPVTRNSEFIRLARPTRAVVDSISVPGRVSMFDRPENKGIVYILQGVIPGTGLMSSRALVDLSCDRVDGRVGPFSAVPSLSVGMTAHCARGSSPRTDARFEHRCLQSALAGLRAVLHSEREPVGHQDSQ
jgi:hypothetical protein